MNVLLDTNAIIAAGIRGPAFKALRDYLERTGSRLLLPNVVLQELLARRRASIKDLKQEVASVFRKVKHVDPRNTAVAPIVDEEALVRSEREYILSAITHVEVVDNEPDDLEDMVYRLANRVAPASSTGEEARDVLVWLCVKRSLQGTPLVFISGDKTFYAKEALRPELLKELGAGSFEFESFRSLDAFLAKQQLRLAFVTKEWADEVLEDDSVSEAIGEAIYAHDHLFESLVSTLGVPTGHINLVGYVQHEVRELVVSDLPGGKLYVGATIWAELEIEVEFLDAAAEERSGSPGRHRTKCIHPCVAMRLQLEVQEQVVLFAEVSSLELEQTGTVHQRSPG